MNYHDAIAVILDAMNEGGCVILNDAGEFQHVPVPVGSAVDDALITVILNDDDTKSVIVNIHTFDDVVMTAKAIFSLVSLVAM